MSENNPKINRRQLFKKAAETVKDKVKDPAIQKTMKDKAREMVIRQGAEKGYEIDKNTQNIAVDMVKTAENPNMSRRQFLDEIAERAVKRNASNRVMDVADDAIRKGGTIVKVVKNVGKKLLGKFSYMDDLVKF